MILSSFIPAINNAFMFASPYGKIPEGEMEYFLLGRTTG